MNPVTQFWPTNIRRMEMKVGIPYGSDLSAALKALENSIEESQFVVKEGVSNQVVFSGFDSSSIDFKIYYWFKREDYFAVQNDMSVCVYDNLCKSGISIPFPQLDIHVVDFPETAGKEETR